MTDTGNPLHALVAPGSATPAIGASNALTARLVEDLGFGTVYVTGAGVANTYLGVPDIGLVSLTELAGHVRAIAESVSIPVIVDADTGFGNALGVQRTVRLLERAGAAAIQLEDQESPKRCGHFDGQTVISRSEMVQKVRAAVDTRAGDLLLIARTDAINAVGFDDAIERAHAYREAGADVVFVEGPADRAQLEAVPGLLPGVPLVANLVEGGRTPIVDRADLAAMATGSRCSPTSPSRRRCTGCARH
ncbi:isocitrate lyase/PEP mutase family protein [Pseudonocardia sp. HH130630-07]|uniref:isocitrate lyase/PEP mutase family protein n=1 Tax=Pseudonocardia sp. HH130630-07 TaxID=1690815 RepID=UPI000B03FDA0|nr:isocitrate lyase/PEP mutase family protein [Pseudonocardia sp. HH130630-07]